MDYDQIKSYFMMKEGVKIAHPYPDGSDVFEVDGNKIGVLTTDGYVTNVYVKCDPNEALALRDLYHSIVPGFQIDQKHWNVLIIDGRLPDELICSQIDGSYHIVTEQSQVLQHA